MLKELASQVAGPLKALFDMTLEKGKLPSDWKMANIIPIFKKGSQNIAENYRPISLTSTLCKMMEHLIKEAAIMKNLTGNISISGSKNATLPILAASILAKDVNLANVPLVKDIFTMLELLKFIGIKVKMKRNKNILELKNEKKEITSDGIEALKPFKPVLGEEKTQSS